MSAVVGAGVTPGPAPAAVVPGAPAPTRDSRAPLHGAPSAPTAVDPAAADGAR
ncbi:hypothetical protein [Actinomycetospora sp. TBRC 11914]|uniref:hypothetical protein n=1 Tax=Actinomycetospora sp. TBRC 11914 TaxID=2729387 RepID=UPI00145CCE0B|nr:hypothetical protein [Actinomycetospora sp. TBRC 11914]NMO91851.1 hypothetical protein [Actinomycetospora sp. TBRC 11914]